MHDNLLDRASGRLGPNAFARRVCTQLLQAFRPAPRLRFDGGELGTNVAALAAAVGGPERTQRTLSGGGGRDTWAHQAGVSALALERFAGRILVSGGADATIRIWDLEQAELGSARAGHTYRPVAEIARAPAPAGGTTATPTTTAAEGHRFGVTQLSFYPFDAAAFLSSSFDQTLRLWATDAARLAGAFDLGSKVYGHAVSPVADHLLVACATQHPAVRLVDLRSGAAVQSLVAPGQVAGAVLAAAWSPRAAHVLATGAVDGTVRLWDVRRAGGLLGLLDQEDALGDAPGVVPGVAGRRRAAAKAHAGPVNGLAWTDDGAYLVSAGHDRRIRVWDMAVGANTLVSFGPAVRNGGGGGGGGGGLASVPLVLSPAGLTPPRQELLFWPNESEILVFRLHDGAVVARLRGMGSAQVAVQLGGGPSSSLSSSSSSSQRPAPPAASSSTSTSTPRSSARRNRVTSLVWRGAGGLGSSKGGVAMGGRDAVGALYSGHLDGQIRAWVPQATAAGAGAVDEDADDDDEDEGADTEERDRKRRALDQAYRSLMGSQITFRGRGPGGPGRA